MNASNSKTVASSKSRRDFLKFSAAAGAASALAGVALPHCHAAGGDTIKLALVGCGGRGTGAVANALSTTGGAVKLFAMADLFEDRLKASHKNLSDAFKDKIDVTPERSFVGFDAFKKAIGCLGPGDVVLLTTHSAFRPMHFEYAVSKGVNVFMEKSFAADAPATRRMQKAAVAADQKNLKVSVGFMWRHSQARQDVVNRLHDGEIGEVTSLRIYRVHGPVFCPRLPAKASELEFQIRHATCFNWASSGFFIDWHCHNIDVACWAKGAWPISAQGMGGRCYPECGNLFDHYTVEYTFADGAKLFAFSRHMNNCWQTYSDFAHGTKGSAVIMTNLGTTIPKIYKSQRMEDDQIVWRYTGGEQDPYVREWQVLLDAIRQNKPHNEAHRGVEANFAGIMGRAATHTGAMITLDEVRKSDFEFVKNIDCMTFDTPAPIKAGPDGTYAAPQPGLTKEC